MGKRSFIWDLDGTLLDSYQVIVDSLCAQFREYGIELDWEETHRAVIQSSVKDFLARMEPITGVIPDAMKERYSEISRDKKLEIPMLPHAREVLLQLQEKGCDNYVFTHRGVTTEGILRNLSIRDVFCDLVTSEMGFPRKPAPDGILYLLEKHHLNPGDTYYVGDRIIDMDCAKNAGISGILYLPPDNPCVPNGSETIIVHDLLEIVGLAESK